MAKALFFILAICSLAGCQEKPKIEQTDIITQKESSDDKIPITILVKYAFSINTFEKEAEEKFPNLDIIQVGNYTSDRGLVEYARRMEHDDLTDIVMTWPLNVGQEYWEDRLLDLSGMPFTGNYHISMLNNISHDGKLYYLPGPAQVRGIVYNKTLFEERGWNVPTDFNSFVALCQEIEKTGIRSIQLGFGNSEVLDTAFIGYSYGDCFSKPKDAAWLREYNSGKGTIAGQFDVAFDTFERMMNAGIWKAGDLDLTYSDREKMLFTRKCAMVEDSVLMARMGYSLTGTTDEFGLMPFFSPQSNSDWARLYMVCYIGLNKHLAEEQNKEKYDMALQLMEYISTPEGQEALSADTGAMFSSVRNVPPPNIVEISKLVPMLNEGRYAVFPELKNAQQALRDGLAGMLKGTLSREAVIKMVDEQNSQPAKKAADESIGYATEDFSLMETGNFITDVLREKAGTEIALFLDNGKDGKYNGKGVSGKIYEGPQTEADIYRICPDLKYSERGVLQKITMTGKDLISTLEYAIPVGNAQTGWFYYFSGLKMEFSPTDAPGSRIKKITDLSGKEIDPAKLYTIAVMDETVPKEYIKSLEETNIYIPALLQEMITEKQNITPSGDNRFIVVNN